jgi:hypothetical protein
VALGPCMNGISTGHDIERRARRVRGEPMFFNKMHFSAGFAVSALIVICFRVFVAMKRSGPL